MSPNRSELPEPGIATRTGEFRRGWPIVAAAALGVAVGISGLLTYNSGLFVADLKAELGLSRSLFGLVFFGATAASALALPLIGRWIDQRGPVAPGVAGALLLSLGFVALSRVSSVATYAAVMCLVGLLAAGSGPIAYNRAVSATFSSGRGLALGLTQVGIGLSAAIVPPMVTAVIVTGGWREAFLFLAILAAAGLVPALMMSRAADVHPPAPGAASFGEVARSPLFRRQLLAFSVMALGFAGLIPHFVPMLRDAGLSPAAAAGFASMIGVSVIVSRVIVGWLADRMNAAWLAAVACLLCGFGCLSLAIGGTSLALVGAVALGCAMGAEADLVGFMTARNFGMARFGRAYAFQYAGFMIAAGAGPAWVGVLRDMSGSYTASLVVASLAMLVAAALFVSLRPPIDPVQ